MWQRVSVTFAGNEHREGLDLTADDFWERVETGNLPEIVTSQPSPGEIAEVYEAALAAIATSIVSVHVGADVSGTVNAANLAAALIDAPVHLVDSVTASFGVSAVPPTRLRRARPRPKQQLLLPSPRSVPQDAPSEPALASPTTRRPNSPR